MFTPTAFYGCSGPRTAKNGPLMDVDILNRNEVLVLPDADVSDPEVEESSDEEEFALLGSDQSSVASESDEDIANFVPTLTARKSSKSKRTIPVWEPLSESDENSEVPFFNGSTNVF